VATPSRSSGSSKDSVALRYATARGTPRSTRATYGDAPDHAIEDGEQVNTGRRRGEQAERQIVAVVGEPAIGDDQMVGWQAAVNERAPAFARGQSSVVVG